MAAHTAGPWWTELDKVFAGTPPQYTLIADADPMNNGGFEGAEPYLANARLIAAAPELLEALEDLQRINRKSITGNEARAAWFKANHTIAKARGQ